MEIIETKIIKSGKLAQYIKGDRGLSQYIEQDNNWDIRYRLLCAKYPVTAQSKITEYFTDTEYDLDLLESLLHKNVAIIQCSELTNTKSEEGVKFRWLR
ncbi:hypothetical protein CEW46_21155 [Bacillus cereus]|nr:hypothetical protein CEW46_21155 [Bacillus cereus]